LRYLTSIFLALLIVLPVLAQNELNENDTISQTQEGITVTLTDYYADSTQAMIWYRIEGLDLPDGRITGAPFISVSASSDDHPTLFYGAQGGGFTFRESGDIDGDEQFDFDEPITETVDVTFEIRLNQVEGMPLWIVPDDFDLSQLPRDEYAYEFPYDLTFSFDVTLTPHPGEIFTPDFSAESNGLSLSIEEIVLTPIRANVLVCFDIPDGSDWQPDIHLTVDGEETLLMGYGFEALPSPDDTSRCSEFRFQIPAIENPSELYFEVDGLVASAPEVPTDEQIEAAEAILAAQGIEANYVIVEHGINYDIISYPDDMTESDVYGAMFHALRARYDASWEFTLDLEG